MNKTDTIQFKFTTSDDRFSRMDISFRLAYEREAGCSKHWSRDHAPIMQSVLHVMNELSPHLRRKHKCKHWNLRA